MRRLVVLGFVVGLVTATWVPASAETAEEPERLKGATALHHVDGPVSISSHLLEAMTLAEAGTAAVDIDARVPVVSFATGLAEVELRYDVYTEANVAAAEAAGLVVTGRYPDVGWVAGLIAPAAVRGLAKIPGLATVHPMYGATTAVGSVENQADVSMRADQARSASGLDGSGVEIGVLSDSFDTNSTGTLSGNNCNQTISGTASQTAGDLPTDVGILVDLPGGSGIDEGRGMAELIHDMVPGADLTFRSAFLGEADFAQGIRDLADCGADVIVDDIIYFAEPMFQDGPVAQAANDVAKDGIPYFSSAGNQGTYGVSGNYKDSDPGSDDQVLGDDLHDFGGGDRFAKVTLDPGEGIRVVLQWNDPFDGSLGPGAISDYDLVLLDSADPSDVLGVSVSPQGCGLTVGGPQGGDPLELIVYTNNKGVTDDVFIAVDQFCKGAGGGKHLRLATYGVTTSITALEFEGDIFTDFQQYGHAVAKNARSVAAAFFVEIDDPTFQAPNGQTNVEPFSSLGGDIPIYFKPNGDPYAGGPKLRMKPEITAADGTNTTFFGQDSPFDPDSDPNFFGTSAAAPHAAAVAALLIESDPSLSRAEVYEILEMTAIDIESSGVDNLSGYGLVDALNAVSACNGVPATIVGTPGDDTIEGTNGDDVIVTFGGNDVVDGKDGDDIICLGDGADVGKGGGGQDQIYGGAGADKLRGQKGGDTLDGGRGGDTLIGGSGRDTLHGGSGKDDLKGGSGSDVLEGDGGEDTLTGGGGADTLRGGGDDDTLSGGGKGDTLKGGSGDDVIDGDSGSDEIVGGGGADTIDGGTGRDTVVGAAGKDVILGGDGDDTLEGGKGGDTIRGQAGDDTLKGGSGGDTLVGGGGTDIVKGGSGNDSCVGETQSGCES